MPTYVAFLRAINLGAKRKFPKADIVAATQAAGGTEVATHINTGNVLLKTTVRSRAKVERALERAYAADRGFDVDTIVFTPAEILDIVRDAEDLARGAPERRHYVSLLKAEPTATAVATLESAGDDRERAVVRGRAVHLLIDGDYHSARLSNAAVEKTLGVATNRNLTVLRAIAEKWCAS